ncbi:hypothetical protein BSQ39_05100 [Loigolactobacillus backii]|uniref:glycosyltransferase family 2 protein n=1 Tax=Loigolactobacillus backii TaxID=375175 RepID=UPI000C1C8650|nr:glycosyltransferase family 2 protein [Loigolactobacillus backii]PIO82995.1 hypothetical protein BSQ39_05100 [Loigolactobacillus backii]
MSVACIILNYNSYVETKKLIDEVKSFTAFQALIVVDNQSTDDSYSLLLRLQNGLIHVIQTNKNGGFGYGNNVGINYANKLGMTYALITNPDVAFTEKIIPPLLKTFEQRKKAVVVVPASYKNRNIRAYHVQSNLQIAMSSSLIIKRLFGAYLGRFRPNELRTDQPVEIGIFSGALFMVDISKFIKVGMFDEHVFLYFEESILAEKIHRLGLKIYLIPSITFEHAGGTTVTRSASSFAKIKEYEVTSKRYFLKKYRNVSGVKLCLYSVFFYASILEMYLYGVLKK